MQTRRKGRPCKAHSKNEWFPASRLRNRRRSQCVARDAPRRNALRKRHAASRARCRGARGIAGGVDRARAGRASSGCLSSPLVDPANSNGCRHAPHRPLVPNCRRTRGRLAAQRNALRKQPAASQARCRPKRSRGFRRRGRARAGVASSGCYGSRASRSCNYFQMRRHLILTSRPNPAIPVARSGRYCPAAGSLKMGPPCASRFHLPSPGFRKTSTVASGCASFRLA